MSVLEVRNLRVRFDTPRGRLQAVDSVSFELDAGELLALVGESGSGKSATALALMSLLPRPPAVIETGEVRLGGRNLFALPRRELDRLRGREIAMVFQDPTSAFHPLLSIGAQLTEVLRIHLGFTREEALERAAEALAEVGIADPVARLDDYPHQLSGGMRQRALIAMALLCKPQVLIADEPTTALDVTVQAQILELLAELRRRHGTAILLITHDLGLVAEYADRVAVMYAGAMVESATTRELFARPAHPYTLGLLRSVPTLATPLDRPLVSIPGAPPDLAHLGGGCAFEPRCEFARPECGLSRPPLLPARGAGAAREGVIEMLRRRVACFESERVLAAGRAVRP